MPKRTGETINGGHLLRLHRHAPYLLLRCDLQPIIMLHSNIGSIVHFDKILRRTRVNIWGFQKLSKAKTGKLYKVYELIFCRDRLIISENHILV